MPRAAHPVSTASSLRELQLATLVEAAPDGPAWLHELKFDGYRILADKRDRRVRLYSRAFKDWTGVFPAIATAIAALPASRLVLDGEVCAVLPDGRTSFQALQQALRGDGHALVYYAFDLLAIDEDDLRPRPLEERKQRLRDLLVRTGERERRLRYSEHVIGGGPRVYAGACARGLEGIISKRRDAPYAPGRGRTWLKVKCVLRQELVIGGFTAPRRGRTGIGALLLGYYDGGALVYAGKVGTGFTLAALADLRRRLAPLERADSPFDPVPPRASTGPDPHWVAPELVAEVAFAEWTREGRLRHPSFQGLREDKRARDVVREAPEGRPHG